MSTDPADGVPLPARPTSSADPRAGTVLHGGGAAWSATPLRRRPSMKPRYLLIALGLAIPPALFANYGIDVALRHGNTDTGFTTKHVASPEITVFRNVPDASGGALGLTYVHFNWSDSTSWTLGRTPYPDEYTGGGTEGKVDWDALLVSYRIGFPIASHWSFYLEPRIGAARAHGSGTIRLDGGITGRTSRGYSFTSRWSLGAEAHAGFAWQPEPGYNLHAGIALARYQIRGDDHPLAGSLSSIQAVVGFGFLF
jgi:hypothetical protein